MKIAEFLLKYLIAGVLLMCAVPSMGQATDPAPQAKLESLDPAFDILVNPQANIDVIASFFNSF